jgi:hypothetical protein
MSSRLLHEFKTWATVAVRWAPSSPLIGDTPISSTPNKATLADPFDLCYTFSHQSASEVSYDIEASFSEAGHGPELLELMHGRQ